MGLRKKQKQERKERIMDAAEKLIRQHNSTDITMVDIASIAEVSPTTTYNLFESKSGLLYALMYRFMDQIDSYVDSAGKTLDPFQRVLSYADAVSGFMASDPIYHRCLYRYLLSVFEPALRPDYMARGLKYWHDAVQGLADANILPNNISPYQIAKELEVHFVGILNLWIHEELNDEQFCAQTIFGSGMLIMGFAKKSDKEKILKKLLELGSNLKYSSD